MIKNYLLAFVFVLSAVAAQAQLAGTIWQIAPGSSTALAVGPAQGDFGWWSIGPNGPTDRPCYFDDTYVFNADGTFENVLGTETWLETWQGAAAEGCGAPIAPHDGSVAATWSYDAAAGTVTIYGAGAYIGLPKVNNDGELSTAGAAADSIVYPVTFSTVTNADDYMTIDIAFGTTGYWHYELEFVDFTSSTNVVKNENIFEVFPNPAADQFTINFDEAISTSANLNIYDFQGKLVKQELLTNQQTVISTDDLRTGLYIIRVDNGEKSYTHKLSVVK